MMRPSHSECPAAVSPPVVGAAEPPRREPWEVSAEIEAREPRNLVALAAYDVVLRVGWIFKTESVIMPAFLDAVAGAGWLRGCLPVINRFGQSIPPALFAGRLRRMPLKKRALAIWTLAMAAAFLVLSAAWWNVRASPPAWMAAFFLVVYALFSCSHGLNYLAYSTLLGKLVRVHRRGRLMAAALPVGSVLAILFAWWLLGDWLALPTGGFFYIFGFTGICFVLSAGIALAIAEPGDGHWTAGGNPAEAPTRAFAEAWQVLRTDANFRRLAIVAMLAATGNVLFPHYQALARERLHLTGSNLMVWVVVQNAAVGIFGLALGWVVDRRGERLALRLAVFGTVLAPLVALAVAEMSRSAGARWFWVVFVPLGMTPVSLKTMMGYTLEIAPRHEHPRYLSTLSLCLAVPFCLSPLAGWLVDVTSFEAVFLVGAVLIAAGGLMTFRLAEPRHHHAEVLEAVLPSPS